MKRPDSDLEKEFNAGGVFFLEEKSLEDKAFEGTYLGVEVEIAVPEAAKVSCPDFSFSVVNKRGVATLMTDWRIYSNVETGQKCIRFLASIRIPEDSYMKSLAPLLPNDRAMTFMDLCFYAGNEAVSEDAHVDTFTLQRPRTTLTDIGWFLPSRFVDTVIDALGKMNDSVLGGMLEEAILYGPAVRKAD